MTRIKLCGLMCTRDIEAANELRPDYVGFVLAPGSRRYVTPERAAELRGRLRPDIKAVGVFVRETPEAVAAFLRSGTIDVAQLHGGESEAYIAQLRMLTDKPVIKAFRVHTKEDVAGAEQCPADYVLLDSGSGGTGTVFDWSLVQCVRRPYFLAGGLNPVNVGEAVRLMRPYAVDVSSGIETDGVKDIMKMAAFVAAVRKEESV